MTDKNLIRELQAALFFWMPSIAGQDGPDGARAENDSMLLMGWSGGNETDCYGDRLLVTIDALRKSRDEALLDAERAREERNREHVRLNAEWMAKCEELRAEVVEECANVCDELEYADPARHIRALAKKEEA